MNLLFIMVMTEVSLIKRDVGWLMLGSTSARLLFCARIMIALPPGEIEADLILNF